jgi:hypothetical protein
MYGAALTALGLLRRYPNKHQRRRQRLPRLADLPASRDREGNPSKRAAVLVQWSGNGPDCRLNAAAGDNCLVEIRSRAPSVVVSRLSPKIHRFVRYVTLKVTLRGCAQCILVVCPGRGRVAPSGLSCQNDTYRTC